MWINFFSKIYLVNLAKRRDRLFETAEHLEEYGIPFSLFTAIEKPDGAEGLRDTMNLIFDEAIANNYPNILVLEDDCEFVKEKYWVDETMNNVIEQLPENYLLCFLGCQITGDINGYHSPNLISANKVFSTHAVMYSLQGIKEIISHGFGYPIDNYYVDKIEPMRRNYCVYPLLASQRAGVSDIGRSFIDWNPFIISRYEQRVIEYNQKNPNR